MIADIYNSTIAFNVEIETIDQDFPTVPCANRGALSSNVLHLESTIVAKNTCTIGPAGLRHRQFRVDSSHS